MKMSQLSTKLLTLLVPVVSALPIAAVAGTPVAAPAGRLPFSGAYIGGSVGQGHYDTQLTDLDGLARFSDDGLPDSLSLHQDKLVGGVQGGYNWRRGNTVVGLEGDFTFANLNTLDTVLDSDQTAADPLTDSLTVQNRLKSSASLRARAGIVSDKLLLYLTGGVGLANLRRRVEVFDDNPPVSSRIFQADRTKVGVTAGAGTEWSVSEHWSVRGEALGMWLNRDRNTVAGDGAIGSANFPYRLDSQEWYWTTRVGANFHF
jgi:outer membrane immunogenic protein